MTDVIREMTLAYYFFYKKESEWLTLLYSTQLDYQFQDFFATDKNKRPVLTSKSIPGVERTGVLLSCSAFRSYRYRSRPDFHAGCLSSLPFSLTGRGLVSPATYVCTRRHWLSAPVLSLCCYRHSPECRSLSAYEPG